MTYDVITIGASYGGWKAIQEVVCPLPKYFSLPILVVQHFGPTMGNIMATALDERSALSVKAADEKERMRPGTVYVASPNYHMLLEHDSTISFSSEEKVNYARPSIDVLFESVSDALGSTVIGILLTDANRDGAAGILKIKANGGVTIVQDPETAEVPIMPRSAIETGMVDHILCLDQIAGFLTNMLHTTSRICI